MSSFDDQELENKLYKQITEYLAPRSTTDEPKVSGIEGVKIQIAERLVLKFPALGLEENERALLMAVKLKFQELKEVILRDEQKRQATEVHSARSETESPLFVSEMGVISAQTRARAILRHPDYDDDIPF